MYKRNGMKTSRSYDETIYIYVYVYMFRLEKTSKIMKPKLSQAAIFITAYIATIYCNYWVLQNQF